MALTDIVNELQAGIEGETTSRSRVVDGLLDLRLEVADRAHLVELVDRILADVPGKSIVLSEWWSDQLSTIALEADRQPEQAGL
ncbi:MAG: hypothetical protein AAGA17_18130 [Actinomycetota bacterium]